MDAVLKEKHKQVGIVLNYCQYGVLYLGSYYNTGPYINFPHFGNSNLGKLQVLQAPARPGPYQQRDLGLLHCEAKRVNNFRELGGFTRDY